MPILPLTARTVATLRAPSDKPRIEYFDAEVPGLSLRITSDGMNTLTLLNRHHGRKRCLTLGRFPDLGLGEARRRATEERGRVAGGADLATEKRDERATYGDTVGALYELYKKATEKKRSWPEQRRIFENEAASTLSRKLSFEFRAHDLRRTGASRMAEAGVDRFHIAHVLNHRSVTHSTVTATTGIATKRRNERLWRHGLGYWRES
jgi:hypothetical protein